MKMRPASPQQAIIARELALLTAHDAFPPSVEHTPGVAHLVADALSRIHDPGKDTEDVYNHPALSQAIETPCPDRPKEWHVTLSDAVSLRKLGTVDTA